MDMPPNEQDVSADDKDAFEAFTDSAAATGYSNPREASYPEFIQKGDINGLVELVHAANVKAGWWNDIESGSPITHRPHVIGEKLMLVVSEISEAMEGHRKNLMDDKLPHRPMVEVELADAMIRIMDLAGALRLDLGGAFVEKRAYNAIREDHQIANRLKEDGKKF